jgi:hypothetical protein
MKKLVWISLIVTCLFATDLQARGPRARSRGIAPVRGQKPAASKGAPLGTGIDYHDGPVMDGAHHVYLIWYGNWAGNTAQAILPDLINNLSGSAYFNINSSYFGNSHKVPNLVTLSGQLYDFYSRGNTLNDADIWAVVTRSFSNGLPTDPEGIYLVLTSDDVDQGGFCTAYCGWHNHNTFSGTDIKYGFIGNADRCPFACAAQSISPNGNPGADGMASVLAHEVTETMTDPDLNAWFDAGLNENADKCAWNFGTSFVAPNGSLANLTLGGRDYYLQQNWVNSGAGSCGLSYQTLPVCYQSHVESIGWQPTVCDGEPTGTTHRALRMEAIEIVSPGHSICYQAHLGNLGWQPPVCDGVVAGTVGQGRRIEALRVWLQAGPGHVEYFGHVQDIGWTGPARDGAVIGTTGQAKRLEAVVIRIVP